MADMLFFKMISHSSGGLFTLRPHEVGWGPVSLWVRFLERYSDPLQSPEKVEEYMSSVAEIAKEAFSTM